MERILSSCAFGVLAILVFLYCVHLSSGVMTEEQCQRQENLTFAPCQLGSFPNVTYFPNFLGHQTTQEAVRGFAEFYPFLQVQCSPYLQVFLCSVYFSRLCGHTTAPIYPCRYVCERARDDCDGAFHRAGTAWPDSLDCNKFTSEYDYDSLCLEYSGESEDSVHPTTTSSPITSSIPRPDPSARFQPLPDDPICQSMPYSTVIYPNMLGQGNNSDTLVELHRYNAFMSGAGPCSDLLRTYLCLAYLPPCKIVDGVASPIPPCRALCELALTDSCVEALAAFKMELPAGLSNCALYPTQNEAYPTCYMPGARYDPLMYWSPPAVITEDFTSGCKEQGCVDVMHGKCHSLGFSVVTFPNILGHTSMQEALDELDRLAPLIDSGCSDSLQAFACYGFFFVPDRWSVSSMPCQSVCQEIWKSCSSVAGQLLEEQPRLMTCRLYPTKNCDSEWINNKHHKPVTVLAASRVNVTHAFMKLKSDSRLITYSQIEKYGVRDKFIINDEVKGTHEEYFELFGLSGQHVVVWPQHAWWRGIQQPAVIRIPPYNGTPPNHCERVDIMHCSRRYFTTAGSARERYSYWEAPARLLDTWQDYFTVESVASGTRCLPRLHDLLCGLMAPECFSQRDFGVGFPCREFCESVVKQCNTSSDGHELSWLLESLRCDSMLYSSEGHCVKEHYLYSSEAILLRDRYQHEEEIVTVYCLVSGDTPEAPPEFYDPDGKRISVKSSNVGLSGRHLFQLSPSLTMLFFQKVPINAAGTYTCKAAGGEVLRTAEIMPKAKCVPSFNHTLCTPFSRNGYVQLPNVLGHTTQYQAEIASYNFLPLLATGCSPDLLELMCALYVPMCPDVGEDFSFSRMWPINLPSQALCYKVKYACAEAAADIGFEWPPEVQCDKMAPDGTNQGNTKGHVGSRTKDCIKLRRYDITDHGIEYLFYGWVDVQGQGAANDYCRVVSIAPFKMLSCALAGTQGENQYNYNSSNPQAWLDLGHTDTWYMKDQDGDGRDDYCRCVGAPPNTTISCLKAGAKGFEDEFEPEGATDDDCRYAKVNRLFGP